MTTPISYVRESYDRSIAFKLGNLLGRKVINLRNSLALLGVVTMIIGIFYIFRSKSNNDTNKPSLLPKPVQIAKGVVSTTNLDKSYHLNPQMQILHKEILRGADLSPKPNLTEILCTDKDGKLTTFKICNYTGYEITFDSKRLLRICKPDFIYNQESKDPSDHLCCMGRFTPDNCQLIVYQLPYLSHIIIVEQKDIDKDPSVRMLGFLNSKKTFFQRDLNSFMKEHYLRDVFQFSELIFDRNVIQLLILAREKENSSSCLLLILPKEVISNIIKIYCGIIPLTEKPVVLYKKYALQ